MMVDPEYIDELKNEVSAARCVAASCQRQLYNMKQQPQPRRQPTPMLEPVVRELKKKLTQLKDEHAIMQAMLETAHLEFANEQGKNKFLRERVKEQDRELQNLRLQHREAVTARNFLLEQLSHASVVIQTLQAERVK